MIDKNRKIKQYICNLILEYWQDKEVVPKEPRKILLGWVSHIMALHNRKILTEILANLDFIYKAYFADVNMFSHYIYTECFESVEFKLMCDSLRGNND